jgi:drug/metabolite transporter (DMT)-like permease
MLGVVPALLAATGFAVFQIVNRRALSGIDVYRGTAALLATGTVVLGAITMLVGDAHLIGAAPLSSLGFCAAAGLVHFFFGWTLLGSSQVRLGVARTGVVIGTVPLFGALVAMVLLDERLTLAAMGGLVLVVAGVAIVISGRAGSAVGSADRSGVGVLLGLATALCWSVSPVLIRQGLEGLPSPAAGATIGMAASTAVYALAIVASHRRATRASVAGHTIHLLAAAGSIIAMAIWLQWTAFDLAPVATVLSLLQLTPPLVVLLATVTAKQPLGSLGWQVWTGTFVTVSGSLVLILGG